MAPDAVLLAYQRRWLVDPASVKVVEKSRRIGLSWAEAADAALHAASRAGGNVFYMAYNLDMTRGYIEDVAFWARAYSLAAGDVSEREEVFQEGNEARSVKVFEIAFDSGHVVKALTSHPRNLRSKGRPGDVIVFDEFAFHDQQAELLKAGLAVLVWGGKLRVISTHNGAESPFNELIEQIRAGKLPYSLHRITLDDALEDGLYERICLITGQPASDEGRDEWRANLIAQYGAGAQEELFCVPARSAGRFIPRAVAKACAVESIDVIRKRFADSFTHDPQRSEKTLAWLVSEVRPILDTLDPLQKHSAGFDFARVSDLSVFWVVAHQPQLRLPCVLVIELSNAPYDVQREIVTYVLDRLPRLNYAAFDATGNGAALAEGVQQTFGIGRVEAITLNRSWYGEHMPLLKADLEDQVLGLPLDEDILDDIGDIERRNGVPIVPAGKSRIGSDGVRRHGDAAIALCLARYAANQRGAVVDFAASGARPERYGDEAYGGLLSAGNLDYQYGPSDAF